MRHTILAGIFLSAVLHAFCVDAQQVDTPIPPRVSIPNTEVRHIRSSIVGDEFQLSIALPTNYHSTDTTYPVLYLTDANLFFAAATQIARMMQLFHTFPEVIIVGIGYPSDSISNWLALRSRDLTPTSIPDPMEKGWPTGGAARLLKFIRNELKPFINRNYRTSSDEAYAGDSYGGLFGLYVLFHEPDTFQRYIIASPSIWYDSLVTVKYEAEYAKGHPDLSATIFMSVGGLEQRGKDATGMVTNMKQLAERLLSRRYPSLILKTVVFDGETHLSVPAAAISRGLRVIY